MESKIICFNKLRNSKKLAIFIEYFIEQAHQFEILEGRRTGKIRDRKKAFVYHSRNEWKSINGDVKKKIIEVKHNTRRKKKDITNIFVTQKN